MGVDNSSFRIPIPQEPKGKPISVEKAEEILLAKLSNGEELESTMLDLAILYSRMGKPDLAMDYINRLMERTNDLERKAIYYLKMGQLMEQIRNFEAAIKFYTQAFSLEPINNEVWYYINNNLGYCLNHFGKYQAAESYCRSAILIDPNKHNAYKNLGISLEGQGQFAASAKSLIKAVQANAADPRALMLLEELVTKQNEVSTEIPDIQVHLKNCREAVGMAQRIQREFVNRLNKKADE